MVFPDLSTSLDGHLGSGPEGTTVGGLSVADRSNMRHAELTFSFAKSVAGVGRRIASLANCPHLLVSPLTSLAEIDEFVEILSLASGQEVPMRLLRERDCQALAPEQRPDLLLSNSHGKQSAQRLGIEFLSMGLPVWDRLGVPLESCVCHV